ncbi:hypothetical protein M8J75_011499 [Diaphorina citri]|nr:hypothetical protein M8J75_011499 [Diaphorina citri]KAI5743371.1 hypothetical protein M8J77_017426 [Diaphorina citri]
MRLSTHLSKQLTQSNELLIFKTHLTLEAHHVDAGRESNSRPALKMKTTRRARCRSSRYSSIVVLKHSNSNQQETAKRKKMWEEEKKKKKKKKKTSV